MSYRCLHLLGLRRCHHLVAVKPFSSEFLSKHWCAASSLLTYQGVHWYHFWFASRWTTPSDLNPYRWRQLSYARPVSKLEAQGSFWVLGTNELRCDEIEHCHWNSSALSSYWCSSWCWWEEGESSWPDSWFSGCLTNFYSNDRKWFLTVQLVWLLFQGNWSRLIDGRVSIRTGKCLTAIGKERTAALGLLLVTNLEQQLAHLVEPPSHHHSADWARR